MPGIQTNQEKLRFQPYGTGLTLQNKPVVGSIVSDETTLAINFSSNCRVFLEVKFEPTKVNLLVSLYSIYSFFHEISNLTYKETRNSLREYRPPQGQWPSFYTISNSTAETITYARTRVHVLDIQYVPQIRIL